MRCIIRLFKTMSWKNIVQMGELAYTASCKKEAVAFIGTHPNDFMRLTIQRILYFWIRDLDLTKGLEGHFGIRSKKSAFTTFIYILPLPFMLLGIVIALREKRPAGVLVVLSDPIPISLLHNPCPPAISFPGRTGYTDFCGRWVCGGS